jgi:SAM-dependent methyltransferase
VSQQVQSLCPGEHLRFKWSQSMNTKLFRYDEPKYYKFGLMLGLANILRNGFRLGTKKTIGKILQPINSYTRFPEYHLLASRIGQFAERCGGKERVRVLDIGSPKCLGLYLAYHYPVEAHLTDIYGPAVAESRILWDPIKKQAKGEAVFSVRDGRACGFPDDYFDIVYSMSVVEHVEGWSGDSQSIREMLRVLKPGGRLMVTVPLGSRYIEQNRVGMQGAARETEDRNLYFFQRIYSPEEVERRILSIVSVAALQETISIQRSAGVVLHAYRRIGTNLRALLGCLNPVLSAMLNRSCEGLFPGATEYGEAHTLRDIYGDLFLRWEKIASVTY